MVTDTFKYPNEDRSSIHRIFSIGCHNTPAGACRVCVFSPSISPSLKVYVRSRRGCSFFYKIRNPDCFNLRVFRSLVNRASWVYCFNARRMARSAKSERWNLGTFSHKTLRVSCAKLKVTVLRLFIRRRGRPLFWWGDASFTPPW